jgi:mono/diheme cytochrome c family protein
MRAPSPVLIRAAVLAVALAGFLLPIPRPAAAPPKDAKGAVPPEVQRGQALYTQYCATCHGPAGKGDGISGQNLPIKPQDLTEGRVLNPLPDHFLFRVIQQGGQAVGLSPLMPAFTPTLGDRQIREVIAYIRTLAQPPFDPKAVLPVPTRREGPVQPIFFSHVIHAGSFQIACQYCHAGARRASAAGLPSVERCMGCHKIVGAQGNPEIDKLKGYWERKEPIPWVRVFKVPEHARFTHKPHVRAGLQCQTCHGRVEAMEQVAARTGQNLVNDLLNLAGAPAEPPKLTMGWCVECHRLVNDRGIQAVQKAADAPIPSVTVVAGSETQKRKAPLDCVNCHH